MTTALALLPHARPGRFPGSDLVALQAQVFQATRTTPRPVPGLMTWVIDRRNLSAAWDRVASADGADTPGIDGVTCGQLKARVGGWLAELADALFHRRYTPAGVRWVDIPKPGRPARPAASASSPSATGSCRRRCGRCSNPSWSRRSADQLRVPPRAVGGRRPRRGVGRAVRPTGEGHRPGLRRAGGRRRRLPHGRSRDPPRRPHPPRRRPGRARPRVGRVVAAGGVVAGRLWWQRTCGLVQGGPLSPLLCNLALPPARRWPPPGCPATPATGSSPSATPTTCSSSPATAAGRPPGVAALRGVLKTRRQAFKVEPSPVGATAGVELARRPPPAATPWPAPAETAFGYVVPDAKVADMADRLAEMTAPPSDKIDAAAFNLGRWIVSVNAQLRDWRQAYRVRRQRPGRVPPPRRRRLRPGRASC